MGWFSDIAPIIGPVIGAATGNPMIGAVIGAGLGAAVNRNSKGEQTTTVEQKKPPEWLDPYWQSIMANAAGLAQQPYPGYSGPRVADLTAPTLTGVDLAVQRATQGAPDLNAARGMSMDIMGGGYLANPYLNPQYTRNVIEDNASQMARSFAQGTAAQNDAAANRQGAYGGSGWSNKQTADAEALSRQIGAMGNQYQLAASTLGAGDYRSGVNQMLGAGALTGNLAQDDWTAIQALGQAGNTMQGQQQKLLDSAYEEFMRQQQWPYQQASWLAGLTGQASSPYSYQTGTTTGPAGSPLAGAVSGGILGAQYGPQIGQWLGSLFGTGGAPGGASGWTSGYDLPMGG